jgi:hypothetical protein
VAEISYNESIDIAVAPDVAWAYRLDYANLPEYSPIVSNLVRIDGDGEPGVGATYTFTNSTDYGSFPTKLWVTEAERPSLIVHQIESGLPASEVCTFDPIDGGTRVTFAVTVIIPDDVDEAGRSFIEDSGRKPVRMELENIKKVLESR